MHSGGIGGVKYQSEGGCTQISVVVCAWERIFVVGCVRVVGAHKFASPTASL